MNSWFNWTLVEIYIAVYHAGGWWIYNVSGGAEILKMAIFSKEIIIVEKLFVLLTER